MKHLLLFFLLVPAGLKAEPVYPSKVPIRLFGSDQKEVGSCQAEAEVAALEHAFIARNFPIQLSTFYRHAYNWMDRSTASSSVLQLYGPGDRDVLKTFGPFVPLSFLPEDARGYPQVYGRKRPPIQALGIFLSGFSKLPITYQDFSFEKGNGQGWVYREGGDPALNRHVPEGSFAQLKELIRQNHPVTVSIHGDLIDFYMSRSTGLMTRPYERSMFPSDPKTYVDEINHAVAAVGFDDSLYGGQGALIVRNSWNTNSEIRQALVAEDSSDPEVQAALESFRYKISPMNLPGYFAIPYGYFLDMENLPSWTEGVSRGAGRFRLIRVDYNSVYNVYQSFQDRVKIYAVPFVCDREVLNELIREYGILKEQYEVHLRGDNFFRFIRKHTLSRENSAIKMARLPASADAGQDHVESLARGELWSYYCAGQNVQDPFPGEAEFNDPGFQEILEQMRVGEVQPSVWMRLFEWLKCKKSGGICL